MKKITFKLAFYFTVVFILLTIGACTNSTYNKIPLNKVSKDLKDYGSTIIDEIITSFNHKDKALYLTISRFTTPLICARITYNTSAYKESYDMIQLILGKITQYKLFQVVDKGVVKTMRYKIACENADKFKFVELKIDVNINFKLVNYYLYLTSKNGELKRENILPKAIKK